MPANFEPDGAFRRGDAATPAKKGKGNGKSKKPSAQTRKIAAATKAKRARNKSAG